MSTDALSRAKDQAAATPARKFMFDLSFDSASVVHRAPERKPVLMNPEQIDELKKTSFDEGVASGRAAGHDEQTAQLNATLASVERHMSILIENLTAIMYEQENHMRAIALSIAKKILPALTAQNGTQEIEALIDSTIREKAREPRLVVRVSEAEYDALNGRIQDIATRRAYPGKVVILADDAVASGDCRIEWADGGVDRDTQKTLDAIEQTVLPS